MKILYVASTCSKGKFVEYQNNKNTLSFQQAQKYNLLLAQGLSVAKADVKLISTRPLNRANCQKFWVKGEKEISDGIVFSYLPFFNYPVLRQLCLLWCVFWSILLSSNKRRETVVVCDALNIAASVGALIASFFRGFKTVGIVTDVPGHLSYSKKVSFNQRLNLFVMRRFKGYLLLTEPMTEVVNPQKRPHIVLEGHADLNMENIANNLEDKADKKICFYAGSLMKIYGIENLVKGFLAADIPNSELHIYGGGDYEQELSELVKTCDNVKYMGVAPNKEIVEAEIKATLLVNPRPSGEDYTKYSFPSKNMEYMASGTPVLTTELPGMPEDHKPHVFLIKKETAEGIAEALKEVFSHSAEELHQFGIEAKRFIISEKSNKAQAKKVIDFIKTEWKID